MSGLQQDVEGKVMRVCLATVLLATLAGGCATAPGGYVGGVGVAPPPPYAPLSTCASDAQGRVPSLGEPLHVDFPPQALETVAPLYPSEAIDAGIEGVVVLDVLVCARGEIADIRVRNSIAVLDASAIDSVRRWYWRAASAQGEPVAAWVEVPVAFELPR